jgi:hypothetical protein
MIKSLVNLTLLEESENLLTDKICTITNVLVDTQPGRRSQTFSNSERPLSAKSGHSTEESLTESVEREGVSGY